MLSSASLSSPSLLQANQYAAPENSASVEDNPAKEAFQDFVAGTFFKQMLKALRSTQGEVEYFGGGQAEKVFRKQMDQVIAEDLADTHGEAFSAGLYEVFEHSVKTAASTPATQLDQIA